MNDIERGVNPEREPRITDAAWTHLKSDYPDTMALYYRITLGMVVKRKVDVEAAVNRREMSLLDVVERQYGLGGRERENTSEMIAFLGLSEGAFHAITQATIQCISKDTGVPLVHSTGGKIEIEAARIRKVVTLCETIEESLLEKNREIKYLELLTAQYFLQGNSTKDIAAIINNIEHLVSPLSEDQIQAMLHRLLGKVDHRRLARIAERSIKAQAFLGREKGQQVVKNGNAELAEQILNLLDRGLSCSEVLVVLGIDANYYKAVLWSVRQDLFRDPEGRLEMESIRSKNGKPYTLRGSSGVDRVNRKLLYPYREFRTRLGEVEQESGFLTTNEFSPLEKELLERIREGKNDGEIADEYAVPQTYVTSLVNVLLGETHALVQRPADIVLDKGKFRSDFYPSK